MKPTANFLNVIVFLFYVCNTSDENKYRIQLGNMFITYKLTVSLTNMSSYRTSCKKRNAKSRK